MNSDLGVHDADLGVHDVAIYVFTIAISAFTMRRSACSRWRDLGVHDRARSALSNEHGFFGWRCLNLRGAEMQQAVNAFRDHVQDVAAGTVLFYYAGHGSEAMGFNWLYGVDHRDQRRTRAMRVIDVVNALSEDRDNELTLVILDACRNDPRRAIPRSAYGERGFIEQAAPVGTMIVFSTSPGELADDGPPRSNSPFTVAFTDALQRLANREIEDEVAYLFRWTRRGMSGQRPWTHDNLIGTPRVSFTGNLEGSRDARTAEVSQTPDPQNEQP